MQTALTLPKVNMMNLKSVTCLAALLAICLLDLPQPVCAQESPTLFITRANAKVARELAFKNKWEGPTSGPKMEGKKRIIFIGSDFKNTSVSTIMKSVQEAVAVAGWEMVPIDCWGLVDKRADAFSRALALKPDGIVLAGINARDQAKEMAAAAAKKVPVVGWHAGIKPGPGDGMFTNIGTDPKEVGQTAGYLAVAESNGKAGVVIFTDPGTLYSVAKSNEIADVIKRCQTCTLLGLEELNLAGGAEAMPATLGALIKRYGKRWTYTITVHDMYLDWMETPANAELISDLKMQGISAGDGTANSYHRLSKKNLQVGIVPEPLFQQGWQIVDELNRVQHGMPASGYTTPVYVVTGQNLAFHGGPKNQFDPDNGYRTEYRKIWGK